MNKIIIKLLSATNGLNPRLAPVPMGCCRIVENERCFYFLITLEIHIFLIIPQNSLRILSEKCCFVFAKRV